MISGINTFEVNESVIVSNGKAQFVICDEHNQPLCNVILNDVHVQTEQTEQSIQSEPKEVSPEHKLLLKLVLEDAEDEYTQKQIEYLIQVNCKKDSLPYDSLFWRLILSELVLLKCFTLEGNVYSINLSLVEEMMEKKK